ncbi:MAG: enolase C-terminal domain-like protein [Candidatus Poribacteria bacterium]|jgi:mannonate dehydratase|nr:enolase C-terminal domain-like protein [Candidatus Poribacteria bacterium]MDP6748518.1 enolase C-terminal domain-like protein [Candidatus Poribacteria bacterium]MDP6998607.1 enolase C-terminal domain-like protein [Candidatus Poribacteria bacterium]
MSVTIEDIKTITTQPAGSRLVVVKITTSQPGLYGLGCATFTQRFRAVVTAVEKHLKPFLIGREVSRIEEIWQMLMVNGYWRNGPVLNNAISGVDQALWDIKGKIAGIPVYDLLGGKCREAAAVYGHAGGNSPESVAESVQSFMEQGYRYIRIQMGGYGGQASQITQPEGALDGAYFDPREYCRNMLRMMAHVRQEIGDAVELLHDIHERLQPIDAVQFAKDVEQFKLFFLEDPLAPEDLEWFAHIRQQCATPIAMGELFNHPREWQPLIAGKLIDFLRMHVSQMGGITPARNAAIHANMYGIRTAWHGPGDTSPVGHAANLHLDLWAPNFGVQEWCRFSDLVYEIFPGLPEVRNGYMYPNSQPGLGIDVNEDLAAKYPCQDEVIQWTQTRLPDGSPTRP